MRDLLPVLTDLLAAAPTAPPKPGVSGWAADIWAVVDDYVHMIEAVGVVGAGVLAFRRWVVKPVGEKIDALQRDVTDVKKEVTFNSGSSLKDAVKRMETQAIPQMRADLGEKIDAVQENVERAHDRIDKALGT